MTRPSIPPTRVPIGDVMTDYELHHPAFGVVVLTQTHGGPMRLFGSDIAHQTCMRLSIYEATMARSHHEDKIDHHRAPVTTIEFSPAQWARMLSSVGNGAGTPCTFNMKPDGVGKPMPTIAAPAATKREVHGEEMGAKLKQRLEAIRGHVDRLGEMIEGGKLGKTELRAVHKELLRHAQQLPESVAFVHHMFEESTEQVVQEAKAEVDAFVNGVATSLGLQHIRDMAPLLNGPKPEGDAS